MTTATGPKSRVSLMVEQVRDVAVRTANNKFTWIIAAAMMGTPWVYTGVVDAFGLASQSGAESERLRQVEKRVEDLEKITSGMRADVTEIKIGVAEIRQAVKADHGSSSISHPARPSAE